ncbi:hypothetical protein KDA_44150 [Dictyobacter alpinus]|uniref:Uncharacterized protein n=1 Tax=Dictyobacter alpinus TaxID=2014873 RepID=A0A402BBX9_9CHLR|nr:hypothetical protein [Dictyobacter alpinus]GCE28931.1 hypothetical protein KDA_44150 [Dictyobacter alpinus]
MFQRRPNENMLIAVGIGIFAMYIIGYNMHGVAIFSTFSTQCFFALVGASAIVLGCAGLYTTWRRRY